MHHQAKGIKRREVSWTLTKKLDTFAGPSEMKRSSVDTFAGPGEIKKREVVLESHEEVQ